jgi:altronate dehydratase
MPKNNPFPFTEFGVWLHPEDNVGIAKAIIPEGTPLRMDDLMPQAGILTIKQSVPAGHKFSIRQIEQGMPVVRYGQSIGRAVNDIRPGEWVHTHNLEVGDMPREFQLRVAENGLRIAPSETLNFLGYPRPGGLFGTRNYIAVISTVSCSGQTAQAIANAFPPSRLENFKNVDGVVAITHTIGCCAPYGSETFVGLQRVLSNLTRHPNIGGVVFVSLGCEGNQMQSIITPNWDEDLEAGKCIIGPYLEIQSCGGIEPTVRAGIDAIDHMLPGVDQLERVPAPLSGLKIALQCGGSDGWSGVTANPLVGRVSDLVVSTGGTVVLSETPEIVGAEQLLLSRVASEGVGNKLVDRILDWQKRAQRMGFSLDNNPSPGNKKGGLTTIFEKSLGAVAKAGSTPLVDVYNYAEWVASKGFVFMDTPGYDPVSVTGQIAGGCNLVIFTTGRGSVFGGLLSPCVKIASNTEMFQRMIGDMDYDAGQIIAGKNMDSAANELFEQVVGVASGRKTKSEISGFRQMEFVPWQDGPTL